MKARWALIAVATSWIAASPVGAGAPAVRPLDVARPGWIRVALDGPAQAWGAPGENWVVLDPRGAPVAVTVLRPPTGIIEVKTESVQETAAGWQVVFDLGPAPARHDALLLDLARPVVAEGCLLEGSDDLADWRPLARGALFRLGQAPGLTSGELRHPPTTHRFLRLGWPRKAGLPEFSRARVQLLPEPAAPPAVLSLSISNAEGALGGPAWLLASPGVGVAPQRLALRWEGAPPEALRVLRAEEGRWRPAGSWRSDAAPPPPTVSLLIGHPSPGPALFRVDARAAGPLQLLSANAELAPRWLLFEAPSAGRYTLVSPAAAPSIPAATSTPAPTTGPVVDVVLGPEEPARPTAAPTEVALPLDTSPLPRNWRAWPVKAPGARPGDVVRVELPVELLAVPGVSAGEIRPVTGEKQLLFLLDDDPLPVLTKASPAGGPRRQGQAWSVDYDLPAPATEQRQMELATSAASPAPVRVEVDYRAGRPGSPAESGAAVAAAWEESAPGRTPFSLLLDLAPPEAATGVQLTLKPAGGAAPQLAGAQFWRLARAVVFAWPQEGDVRLVSGFDSPASTGPRQAAALEWLAAQPARPAAVDLAAAAAEGRRIESRARFALVAALVIAAAALIFVLARSLGRAAREEKP